MMQSGAFRVLACFYDRDVASFAELCKDAGYPTDLGGYYIRQLVRGKYLEKVDRGQYRILPKGKQELAINYGRRVLAPKARLGVVIIARQQGKYAVIHRKIQPFIGTYEWPAGMISGGEDLAAGAKRIATDRFGYVPELHQTGFFRRIDMYDQTIFDDKLFAVFTCELPENQTIAVENERYQSVLRSAEELHSLKKPSPALFDILDFAEAGKNYDERRYLLTPKDLSLESE